MQFGTRDWRLLLWTFGAPFVGATITAGLDQFGPTGSICYFDAVKGGTAQMWFTTVPVILLFSTNVVLYFLTWLKIRHQTEIIMQSLGNQCTSKKASIRAAQAMLLFLVAFFIQWGALSLFGLWNLITADPSKVPEPLYYIVVILSNMGGVLNLGVYFIIRRRQRGTGKSDEKINTSDTKPSTSRL
ncbi:hypothetical protein DPMN_167362 [Dreissena polymorpha]|uniref:G-protein coupled receptors family 1 profile domain-containing protein n=2 Tax=Dreissena polymorpha TaxID=45954 RepID=A0A9D4EYP0_DREPO|nr:hypothetical protein DPMN_167362 [Dreissena polymorpha]